MAEHGRQVVGGQGFPERRLWDEYQMSMGTVQIIIIFRVASHTVHSCGHWPLNLRLGGDSLEALIKHKCTRSINALPTRGVRCRRSCVGYTIQQLQRKTSGAAQISENIEDRIAIESIFRRRKRPKMEQSLSKNLLRTVFIQRACQTQERINVFTTVARHMTERNHYRRMLQDDLTVFGSEVQN
ncbi:hypothetical protein HELRODRAFT_184500 [Helobdella robusta]|uniref:Uncharacterized protein n=1 Tax=Helobdella robusta TaxID=6412 RepID=T1FLC1_HELRO|nr:hypothetical protein HELRODRAFT_184500 [Helobdella robusta]ESN93476.1 hypothetical protein HELRODRAFT_184500 [Helobdella robusta]